MDVFNISIDTYPELNKKADSANSFAKVVGSAQNVMSRNALIRDYIVIL
jgi:hypothetical protein